MQKIRRIILLFSSVFLFYHTSNLNAITYEYVTFGNMAYGSGSNTGSGSGSGTGGAPSTTPGSHYEYPEIYQQQPTAEEAQAKAEAEARAKEEAARLIAEAEARLAEEKRQAEEQARLEEEARQAELARLEAERQAELARQEAERQRQEAERQAEIARILAEEKAKAEAQRKQELQNEISELITEIQSINTNNNKTSDEQAISQKITELQQELVALEIESATTKETNIEENITVAETLNSTVTGDPVKTTTGSCIQTSNDIAAGWFQITRYYESDRTTVSSFGTGWCSNLDERIILGTQPMVQQVYDEMTTNLQKLRNKQEDYQTFICTNLDVNSVETARQEIEEKLMHSQAVLSRANMIAHHRGGGFLWHSFPGSPILRSLSCLLCHWRDSVQGSQKESGQHLFC